MTSVVDVDRETLLSMGFYKWWRESELSRDVRMLERVVSPYSGVVHCTCELLTSPGSSSLGRGCQETVPPAVEKENQREAVTL